MADITFYLKPVSDGSYGGTASWGGTYADVDDPPDSVDDRATSYYAAAAAAGTRTHYRHWLLTPPQTGVTITKIRVHYKVWTERGGTYQLQTTPQMKGVVYVSGSYYTSATAAIVGASQGALMGSAILSAWPFYNRNTSAWGGDPSGGGGTPTAPVLAYWEFATNPATGLVWTVSELQDLRVVWSLDTTKQSLVIPQADLSGHELRITVAYVEVFAVTAAASIESNRLMGSAYLRLFRNGVEPVSLKAPLTAATVDIGDVVSMAHPLAPAPGGTGWGVRPWERHYGLVLGKNVDTTGRTVSLEALDLYRFFCNLWFPAITDLPYTEEGQGIPYLDAGGGRSFTRYATNAGNAKTKGYVRIQDKDVLHVEVPQDKEKWSPEGVALFRESYASILNDSFSQGSGSAFTSWTNAAAGTGAIAESTSKYLFDVSGLRRSCALYSGTGGAGNYAGVYQACASLGASGWLRVHVVAERYNGSTAGNLEWRLVASDGQYWNDAGGTWQVAFPNNPLTAMAVGELKHTWSKVIPAHGTGVYTLHLYANGGAGDAMYLYYACLWWGASKTGGASSSGADMQRPPFVTTTVAAYEGQDILKVANPATARSWDPTRGTGLLTLKTAWAHADVEEGTPFGATPSKCRVLALNYVDTSNYDAVLYYKETNSGDAYLALKRRIGGVDSSVLLLLTGADAPSIGSTMNVAWRWQATDGELDLGNYAGALFCSTDGRPVLKATGTLAAWNPGTTTIYLGSGFSSQADGWIRDVEIVPFVLPDVELYRRMGV